MQTTNAEIAVIHDNEWCSPDNYTVARTIDEYAETFFHQELQSTPAEPEKKEVSTHCFDL
jgi:hypothetical protein